MGVFAWLYGNSKSAAKVRAEKRGLRLFDPDQIAAGRGVVTEPQTSPSAGGSGGGGGKKTINDEPWYNLISSNVDRIRYHMPTQELQVVFKDGSCYQYENVEARVFQSFLGAASPGQFVWYVLRQYGYPYRHLGGGFDTSAPAPGRFDEQPFAVTPEMESIQRQAGRKPKQGGLWNFGTPTAQGFMPPHEAFE